MNLTPKVSKVPNAYSQKGLRSAELSAEGQTQSDTGLPTGFSVLQASQWAFILVSGCEIVSEKSCFVHLVVVSPWDFSK
jgi:hypothetical protein